MQRLRTILSVTSVRLSIAYTVIFALVSIIIILYMTGSTAGILRKQIVESINEEVVGLERIYERGGINGLMRQLERRASAPGANLYVVSDPAGSVIAGNVRDLDTGVIDRLGWTRRAFEYEPFEAREGRDHYAIARVIELPNSMRLLIGRDLGEPERFRKMVGRALGLSLMAMLVLGLLTWVLVGRRALKRLDLVGKSTSRILAGDRSERLPVTGSNDEFDRLSQRLNAMLDRINKLDEGLRQVSDNIAHDLKTPLTRLRNKADAALSGGKGKNSKEALGEIITDTDQIIKTFNALLMISRVESGATAAEFSQLDLSTTIADVAELYQPVAEEAGVTFETDIEPGLTLRGNRELLSQAVSNLIDNALKYGQAEKQALQVSARSVENSLQICVADSGLGIAEKDFDKVTKRFVRLEESRTKPGNGLGLSLVNAVAQLHGGTLELSDNGPGLKACMVIPVGAGK